MQVVCWSRTHFCSHCFPHPQQQALKVSLPGAWPPFSTSLTGIAPQSADLWDKIKELNSASQLSHFVLHPVARLLDTFIQGRINLMNGMELVNIQYEAPLLRHWDSDYMGQTSNTLHEEQIKRHTRNPCMSCMGNISFCPLTGVLESLHLNATDLKTFIHQSILLLNQLNGTLDNYSINKT